ncbi:unnamed protein product, partial [Polarella glacialis]
QMGLPVSGSMPAEPPGPSEMWEHQSALERHRGHNRRGGLQKASPMPPEPPGQGSAASSSSSPELKCQSMQVLMVREGEAKAWLSYLPSQIGAPLASMVGGSSSSSSHRHLELLPSATVGQARRCFGHPLAGAAQLLASADSATTPAGPQRSAAELADETPLWQISQGCRVSLGFNSSGAARSELWQEKELRTYWRTLSSIWHDYRSGD